MVLVYPSFDSPEAVKDTGDQRRLWSDCADAQSDLRLRWSHFSYCRFGRSYILRLPICFTAHKIPSEERSALKKRPCSLFVLAFTVDPFLTRGQNNFDRILFPENQSVFTKATNFVTSCLLSRTSKHLTQNKSIHDMHWIKNENEFFWQSIKDTCQVPLMLILQRKIPDADNNWIN